MFPEVCDRGVRTREPAVLLELGVVEFTRETGPSKRYQLNDDSDVADLLYKLAGTVPWTRLDERNAVDYERED